jgi:translation initiation factor IF-3
MAMGRGSMRRDTRGPQIRVNHRIRVPEVRVVADDGSMLGVMTTQDALRHAKERGLDLVEVNPKSNPPVCKILDFGKYKYDEKKRASEARRKQTVIELKEIKLRPKTDEHDLAVKLRAAKRFLEAGNKVKLTVRFRGREITHPERARMQLDWLLENTTDVANVELRPQMEGRTMALLLGPKPAILQKLASERAAKEAEHAEQRLNKLAGKGGEDDLEDDVDAETPEDELDEELHEPDDDDDDDDDESDDDESDEGEKAAES